MKNLEIKVKDLKNKFWPSVGVYTSKIDYRLQFRKNLSIENITIDKENGFEVVYAGERYTQNNKVQHKFYKHSTTVEKDSVIDSM